MDAIAHELTWVAAAPLWKERAKDREHLRRPALLRFTSDKFMEDLFGELAEEPGKIGDRLIAPAPDKPIKLFQPVHGHFHLVAASLVCQVPGLPDHAVDPAREERAELVLRRLSGKDELAWIPGADASAPGAWKAVVDPEAVMDGEELLPLFPGAFADEGGKRRRLFFGLVPTSSRETFQAAQVTDAAKVTDDGEAVLKTSDSAGVLVPKLGAAAGALYVIRCVYRRPRCYKEPPLLSDPTERFAIAGYFDPDAPARTIRIAMPTSVAALMKAKKGVGIVLSNEIRKKISAIGPDILKGTKGSEDGLDIGHICSLSIPVITIIAMIIIMVFVALLDLIFQWSMWPIKICLPLVLKPKE